MEKVAQTMPVHISISVVSHGQMAMVVYLMQDIQKHCQGQSIELLLTLNINEKLGLNVSDFSYPITVIENAVPKGFGANHNQAFEMAKGDYFCIVNPDIRLNDCPFLRLMTDLRDTQIGVAAPVVLNPSGGIEDSARSFPTPWTILQKLFTKNLTSDYVLPDRCVHVDWVGGMFMMFPRPVFECLKGFDERYFLYYEDVDICSRLNLLGLMVTVNPESRVVHHAQRTSHRSFTYLRWHLSSMLRYFMSPAYWQLKRLRRA